MNFLLTRGISSLLEIFSIHKYLFLKSSGGHLKANSLCVPIGETKIIRGVIQKELCNPCAKIQLVYGKTIGWLTSTLSGQASILIGWCPFHTVN